MISMLMLQNFKIQYNFELCLYECQVRYYSQMMWKIKCKLPSTNKLFRVLYWTLYLGLCFISGWFVSGVLENYISRKTSFSQDEEIATKRPVISIIMFSLTGEGPVINKNIWIWYCPSYKFWQFPCEYLDLGENEFFIKEINDTEKVFFGKVG